MKKTLAHTFAIGTLGAMASLVAPTEARGTILLEPILGAGFGQSNAPLVTEDSVISYGAAVRLGLEKDDVFSAIEAGFALAPIGPGDSGKHTTVGITGGMTMTYIPLRIYLGFDFADAYSDSAVSLGGSAFRLGLSYYLKEKLTLNLQYGRHLFTGVNVSATTLPSFDSVAYSTVGLTLSMPLSLELPKTPWRKARKVQQPEQL